MGRGLLHVDFDRLDRLQLIQRFVVGEGGVEFALPFGVSAKGDARPGGATRLQLEQLDRHVLDRRLGRFFALQPGLAADGCQPHSSSIAAHVFLDELDFGGRHVELGAAMELDGEVLFDLVVALQQLEPSIPADAVGQVNDQVVFAQIEKAVDAFAEAFAKLATLRRNTVRWNSSLPPSSSMPWSVRWKPAASLPTVNCSRPDVASSESPKISERRSISADVWQIRKTSRSPAAASANSSRTVPTSPLKRSTDSTGSLHTQFGRRRGEVGNLDESTFVHRFARFADPQQILGRIVATQIGLRLELDSGPVR